MTKPRMAAPKGSPAKAAIAAFIKGEPSGIAEMVAQMDTDYQVVLGDRAIRANAKQAKISFTAATTDAREIALAANMESLWWNKFSAILDCFKYGRVAFEKVYEYDRESGINTTQLNELPYKLTSMKLEPNEGTFQGIEVQRKGKEQPLLLDPHYSWWLSLDATPLEPHGRSRYLGAPYQQWKDKRQVTCFLGDFVKRCIFGGKVVRGPLTFENPDGPDQDPVDGAAAFHAAESASEGGGGTLYLSNSRILGENGAPGPYEIDVERWTFDVKDGRPILDIITHFDMTQLLAMGIPPKVVMEGDAVGSMAMVTQQMLIFLSVVEEVLDQCRASFQEYVIDKAVAQNDASGKWCITADYTPLTERPDDLASEIVKSWLTTPALSPLITSGAVDVVPILESVGINVSDGAGVRLQKWVDAQAAIATVPPPAPLQMDLPSFLPRLW